MASSPTSAPPPASSSTPPPTSSSTPPPASSSTPPPASSSTPPPASSSTPPPASSSTPPPTSSSTPPASSTTPPTTPSASPPPDVTANPPTSAQPPATPSPQPTATPPTPSPPPVAPASPPTSGGEGGSSPAPSIVSNEVPTSSPAPIAPASPPNSEGGGGSSPAPSIVSNEVPTSSPTPIAPASLPSSGGGSGSSPPPPPPPPPSNSTQDSDSGGSSSSSTGLVVGLVAGGAVLLVLLALVYIWKRRRGGRRHDRPAPSLSIDEHAIKIPSPKASRPPQFPSGSHPPSIFSSSEVSGSPYSGNETPPSALGFTNGTFAFEELVRATDGFSNANLLGQGGFGYVHKGVLPGGKEVAVKQLKTGSGQGEREFQAEVEIITRVHHKHLVSLIGYCITGERRLLAYEFVPNNTLEFHLHGKGRPTLDWSTRMKIGLGSAKGLAYLHEDCHPKIIHRDIKAANILIDYNFEAKVADFGLAKFSTDNNTHVSTRVMGTFGYLAPEYASSGKLTEKSDVFSFGIMLLELITGRRPVDTTDTFRDDSLVDWARPLLTRALEDGNYDFLADPRLQHNYNTQEMAHMVACAAACVRHSARRRPRMTQIVRALEGDVSLDDLNEGMRPGQSTVYGSVSGSDYDSGQYNEDMRKFRKLALSSQEYASSTYSAATSEYGQNPSGSSSEVTMKKDT